MNAISGFGLEIWFVFPVIMLILLGGMLFFIVHFWRLARARDRAKKQEQKKSISVKRHEQS